MTQRSPIVVFLLTLVTFGIYPIVWLYKTKEEMNTLGAEIPTMFYVFIPVIGPLLWAWKYAQGVEKVTRQGTSAGMAFIYLFIGAYGGFAMLQSSYNKLELAPAA